LVKINTKNEEEDTEEYILDTLYACESCGGFISEREFDEFGVCEFCMSEGRF
jgi:hypothetical protein